MSEPQAAVAPGFELLCAIMIVDLHCHLGLSARRVDPRIDRFSFEPEGARGRPGFDSYMSDRMLGSVLWRFIRSRLGLDRRLSPGDELDDAILARNETHLLGAPGIDRFVLLAFDEYHRADGSALGPVQTRKGLGTDLYTSNSLARHVAAERPEKFLFGGSIHPYRPDASSALDEVDRAGAVLIKWLPVHQNIDPRDDRVAEFVARAGRMQMPLLIHYGGESLLTRNHRDQEDPRPMFDLLERVRAAGPMPPVIIAHLATPSRAFQHPEFYTATVDALLRRFADDPLYADVSALTHRGWWLRRAIKHRALHRKLVFGTDFPVPPTTACFPFRLMGRRASLRHPSWAQRSLCILKALGLPDDVFTRGFEIIKHRLG